MNSIRHTHTHNNYINALKVKKKIDLPPNGNSFLAKMGNSETDSHWICALQCVFCHNILLPFLWPLNLAKPLFRDSSSLRIDVIVLLLLSFYIFDGRFEEFFYFLSIWFDGSLEFRCAIVQQNSIDKHMLEQNWRWLKLHWRLVRWFSSNAFFVGHILCTVLFFYLCSLFCF